MQYETKIRVTGQKINEERFGKFRILKSEQMKENFGRKSSGNNYENL